MKLVILLTSKSSFLGFSKIMESGYDEEADLYYIVMNKLDEDLSTIVKKGIGRLSLQTVVNLGLELVRCICNGIYRFKELKLCIVWG
jgi:hypothetical protein